MSASPPTLVSARDAIPIRGGEGAPRRARSFVYSRLEEQVSGGTASLAALIVSELVTNSVVHAKVDCHQTLSVELITLDDRLRLAVTDPGADLRPRLLPPDALKPGGFGLRLVEKISSTWGVIRDASGRTRVWCELPLDSTLRDGQPRPSWRRHRAAPASAGISN